MVEAQMLLQLVHTGLQVAHRQLHLGYDARHLLQPERLVLQLGDNARAPVKLLHALLQLTQPRHKAPQVDLRMCEDVGNLTVCFNRRVNCENFQDPDPRL